MSSPIKKLLKDYVQDKWLEAADGCDYCGARYEVKVESMEEDGSFGDVAYRILHKKDCPDRYDPMTGHDTSGEVFHDVAGWTFKRKTVSLLGRKLLPLATRANIGPCLSCGKLIVHAPIILFVDVGKAGELDFCTDCVEDMKLLADAVSAGGRRK